MPNIKYHRVNEWWPHEVRKYLATRGITYRGGVIPIWFWGYLMDVAHLIPKTTAKPGRMRGTYTDIQVVEIEQILRPYFGERETEESA